MCILYRTERGGEAPPITAIQSTQAHSEFLTTSISKQKPRLHKNYLCPLVNYSLVLPSEGVYSQETFVSTVRRLVSLVATNYTRLWLVALLGVGEGATKSGATKWLSLDGTEAAKFQPLLRFLKIIIFILSQNFKVKKTR